MLGMSLPEQVNSLSTAGGSRYQFSQVHKKLMLGLGQEHQQTMLLLRQWNTTLADLFSQHYACFACCACPIAARIFRGGEKPPVALSRRKVVWERKLLPFGAVHCAGWILPWLCGSVVNGSAVLSTLQHAALVECAVSALRILVFAVVVHCCRLVLIRFERCWVGRVVSVGRIDELA
jgi:hypothetical protein